MPKPRVRLGLHTYSLVCGGLEAAIKRGIHRADKHADDDPLTETQRDRVAYHVEQAVREALSEIIDWERSGVPER